MSLSFRDCPRSRSQRSGVLGVHRLLAAYGGHLVCRNTTRTADGLDVLDVTPLCTFCNFLHISVQNVDQGAYDVQNCHSRSTTRFTVRQLFSLRSARRPATFLTVLQNRTVFQALLRWQISERQILGFTDFSWHSGKIRRFATFNSFRRLRRQEDCSQHRF